MPANEIQAKAFIEKLASDLKPSPVLEKNGQALLRWSVISTLAVVAEFLVTGGFRPSAFSQIASSPAFLFETVVGVALVYFSGYAAVLLRIPDESRGAWVRWTPLILMSLFCASVAGGFFWPKFSYTEEHHRYYCAVAIMAFGIIPTWLLYDILAAGAPTQPQWSGALVILASMGLPMVLMEVGCMYSPEHVLFDHILPVFLMALLGAKLLGKKFKERL